jgi:hypothetical protein
VRQRGETDARTDSVRDCDCHCSEPKYYPRRDGDVAIRAGKVPGLPVACHDAVVLGKLLGRYPRGDSPTLRRKAREKTLRLSPAAAARSLISTGFAIFASVIFNIRMICDGAGDPAIGSGCPSDPEPLLPPTEVERSNVDMADTVATSLQPFARRAAVPAPS